MIELHARNAAAMWASLAAVSAGGRILSAGPHFAAAQPTPYSPVRAIVLSRDEQPAGIADRADALRIPGVPTVLEDPYGQIDLSAQGYVVRRAGRMTVMVRPPDHGAFQHRQTTVDVSRATGPRELAVAERTIVEGFPVSSALPWTAGRTLPETVLSAPGWSVYLASVDGIPAGAGYTWHDVEAAGIYWLTTLPAWRGRGVARAIITEMLDDMPDLPMTLTASALGEPLYRSLGFEAVARAHWWVPADEAILWAQMATSFS